MRLLCGSTAQAALTQDDANFPTLQEPGLLVGTQAGQGPSNQPQKMRPEPTQEARRGDTSEGGGEKKRRREKEEEKEWRGAADVEKRKGREPELIVEALRERSHGRIQSEKDTRRRKTRAVRNRNVEDAAQFQLAREWRRVGIGIWSGRRRGLLHLFLRVVRSE